MKKLFKLVALVVLGCITFASVQGCNTIRGAGKDIEKGGQKIEKAAEK